LKKISPPLLPCIVGSAVAGVLFKNQHIALGDSVVVVVESLAVSLDSTVAVHVVSEGTVSILAVISFTGGQVIITIVLGAGATGLSKPI
jgi:hypothetical protein